jgi:hypothetical protein
MVGGRPGEGRAKQLLGGKPLRLSRSIRRAERISELGARQSEEPCYRSGFGSGSKLPSKRRKPAIETCGVPTQTLALPPTRLAGRPFQLPLLSSRRPVTVGRCARGNREGCSVRRVSGGELRDPGGAIGSNHKFQSQEMSRSWGRKGICSFSRPSTTYAKACPSPPSRSVPV